MHGYATFNMLVPGPQICCHYEMCTVRPRTSIVSGNYVRETSVKRRNKIVQEITRNVANVFSFYAIIAIKHGFQCINIRQVPWEVLKLLKKQKQLSHGKISFVRSCGQRRPAQSNQSLRCLLTESFITVTCMSNIYEFRKCTYQTVCLN